MGAISAILYLVMITDLAVSVGKVLAHPPSRESDGRTTYSRPIKGRPTKVNAAPHPSPDPGVKSYPKGECLCLSLGLLFGCDLHHASQ